MEQDVPVATGMEQKEGNKLSFLPSNITVTEEEFWDIWHSLKNEIGEQTWRSFVGQEKDYDKVQTRYLELNGLSKYADPFNAEDGFVDAVQ